MPSIRPDGRLVLELIAPDTTRTEIPLHPPEIHRAVQALEEGGELFMNGRHTDGRVYLLSVLPREDGVLVSLQRDDETRWLARIGDDARLDDGIPRRYVVPRVWATSVIGIATTTPDWPPTFPWHDVEQQPIHALALDAFSFDRCLAHPAACAEGIARAALAHLSASTESRRAIADVIAELRRVRHDLWAIDTDAHLELWSSDYMRAAEGQGLTLEVVHAPALRVHVRFRDAQAELGGR